MSYGASKEKNGKKKVIHYENFQSPSGYEVADYLKRWGNIYGPGELAYGATRTFEDGALTVAAIPFKTGADQGVFDHIKYFAISSETFSVPANGSVTVEATISARTPGIQKDRVVRGSHGPAGAFPEGKSFEAVLLGPQQAAVTFHLVDLHTGQLFDWFIADGEAMTLVERLPSAVTGSTLTADQRHIYTQIIRGHAITAGSHRYGIRFWRSATASGADYVLDGKVVDQIHHVGVPLDRQSVAYSGLWPALGEGEEIAPQMNTVAIAHGLFSLVDQFPFQYPAAPEKSISFPMSERLFGQGAEGTFRDFVVTMEED